ncbi:hypothetical protein ACFL5G_02035 [Candidatus Margulisiibacteriota bacterium]
MRSSYLKQAVARYLINTRGLSTTQQPKFFLKDIAVPGQLDPQEKALVLVPYYEKNQKKQCRILIHNKLFKWPEINKLWVSNNPEKVTQPGVLFEGSIKKGKAIKLLYYHLNDSREDRKLALVVENRNAQMLKLHLTVGLGGPGKDEVYLGHLATKRFLNSSLLSEGEYVEVPAFSAKGLFVQNFRSKQIVTGLAKLSLIDGEKALVYLSVVDELSPGGSRLSKVEKKVKELTRGGVFRGTQRVINKKYMLGNKTKEISIGDKPFVRDERTHHVLKGNYGVQYKILLTLINPHAEAKTAEVLFTPAGGIARGIFIIDGRLKETAWLKPGGKPSSEVIYSTYLEPREKKDIEIITQPQAGSYYPVRIGFRES